MKTIAQQLNVKNFPFVVKDFKGNEIYFENSTGYWSKSKFDAQGNMIYFEDFNGYWWKKEYDSQGKLIYFEDSTGEIIGKRPKKVILSMEEIAYRPKTVILTMDEIAKKFNIPVDQLQIKK